MTKAKKSDILGGANSAKNIAAPRPERNRDQESQNRGYHCSVDEWQSTKFPGHWIPSTAENEVPTEFVPGEAGVDPQLVNEQNGDDEDAGSARSCD